MIDHDELVLAGRRADPAFLELTDQITERLQAGEEIDVRDYLRRYPQWAGAILQAAADHARSRRLWPGRRPRPPARTERTGQTERRRQSQTLNRRRSSLDPQRSDYSAAFPRRTAGGPGPARRRGLLRSAGPPPSQLADDAGLRLRSRRSLDAAEVSRKGRRPRLLKRSWPPSAMQGAVDQDEELAGKPKTKTKERRWSNLPAVRISRRVRRPSPAGPDAFPTRQPTDRTSPSPHVRSIPLLIL